MHKIKELQPIKESADDYDALEARILALFRREIYLPLLKELNQPARVLKNSIDDLAQAIMSGRIEFYRGKFTGKLSASLSRELRAIGAKWDRKHKLFTLSTADLPTEISNAIALSESRGIRMVDRITKKLADLVPQDLADKFTAQNIFDTTLWKLDKSFQKTVKGITVAPELTPTRRAAISAEYTNNMKLYIKDFSQKEISKLRTQIQESAFSGNRVESMVKTIQKSYDVSHNKAKFLARQETSILMAKFKASRYEDAGINEYKWGCVAGSPNHPVRPMHEKLKGKICRFDDPPIVNEKGDRKNPGEDYGCRCFARPIVRF